MLAKGAKAEFWLALKKELELSAETNEVNRDEVLEADSGDPGIAYAKARGFHKAARAYKATISNVENADTRIEKLNREMQDISRQLNDLKEKDTTGGNKREVKNQVC